MKFSIGAAGAALSLLLAVPAFGEGPKQPSLLDLYRSGCDADMFRENPNAVGFATVGSVDGKRFARLTDEAYNALSALNGMMDEAGVSGSDLIEIRISLTSAANAAELKGALANDTRFLELPLSYEVVPRLPVSWARVGVYAVGAKAGVKDRLRQQFGEGRSPATGQPAKCTGSWMVAGG